MLKVGICIQKGGVGKTSAALALSQGLRKRGYKVLAVDVDPQENMTDALGGEVDGVSLYDVMRGQARVRDAIQNIRDGLDLLSVGLSATRAEEELQDLGTDAYFLLNKALSGLKYDFCIMDGAPRLGILSENIFCAADYLIIPLLCDVFCLSGVENLYGDIMRVSKDTKKKPPKIAGLLINQYKKRQTMTAILEEKIREIAAVMGTRVFDAKIREGVDIKKVQLIQGDLFEDAPTSGITKDYDAFITEFLKGVKHG